MKQQTSVKPHKLVNVTPSLAPLSPPIQPNTDAKDLLLDKTTKIMFPSIKGNKS